jgi:hypothetical protein
MHSPFLGPARIVIPVLCVALSCGVAHAGKLFKWVDANGVTHYSDVPAEGAQSVAVEGAQSYHAPEVRASTRPSPAPTAGGAVAAYGSLAVTAPSDGAVLWNENGGITVAADLEPALAVGHHLWFVLDGARHEATGTSAEVPAPRGEHSLVALVTDGAGAEIVRSAPVTFSVRQNTSIRPPQGPAVRKKPHA